MAIPYKFLGADLFLRYVTLYRVCVVYGRYGSGKTLLSVAIADTLRASDGYSIYSNIPVAGQVEFMEQKQIRLLDEAWLLFMDNNSKALRAWFAYLRKEDAVVLLPSVLPLAGKFFQLKVFRLFNGLALGLPFFLYRWTLPAVNRRGKSIIDTGIFWLFNPSGVYGLYDHWAMPKTFDSVLSPSV